MLKSSHSAGQMPPARAGGRIRNQAVVRAAPVLADNEGMKPIAVQYPHSLNVAVSELARASARHGVTAYTLSLLLAALTFFGSVFYKEITHTFARELFGVRMLTLWEGLALLAAVGWLAAMVLAVMCLPQAGRSRTFGVSSIGINLAAALLVACTVL